MKILFKEKPVELPDGINALDASKTLLGSSSGLLACRINGERKGLPFPTATGLSI